MTIGINTSPLAGQSGKKLTARLLKNRLEAELIAGWPPYRHAVEDRALWIEVGAETACATTTGLPLFLTEREAERCCCCR